MDFGDEVAVALREMVESEKGDRDGMLLGCCALNGLDATTPCWNHRGFLLRTSIIARGAKDSASHIGRRAHVAIAVRID